MVEKRNIIHDEECVETSKYQCLEKDKLFLGKCDGVVSGIKLYVWLKASVQYFNLVQISKTNQAKTHIFVFNQKFLEYEIHDVSEFLTLLECRIWNLS